MPAYYDGASIHGAWAASWATNAQGYSSHAQGDDMTLMRLDVPLGSSLGWFGFRTYVDDWEDQSVWTLPGYPSDKDSGNRPWLHMNFPIIDDDNDVPASSWSTRPTLKAVKAVLRFSRGSTDHPTSSALTPAARTISASRVRTSLPAAVL